MARPKHIDDLKTIIGTKCFNCKIPLGYVVTPITGEQFKDVVANCWLYYYCEKCLQEHFGVNGN